MWFFELHGKDRAAALLQQVRYAGAVEAVTMNAEHAAVLCQGARHEQHSRNRIKLCFKCRGGDRIALVLVCCIAC